MKSVPITRLTVLRQAAEPTNPTDGLIWINPVGGTNGNNTDYQVWNQANSTWEGFISIGPDSPTYPVDGTLWSDTANDTGKVYDGSSWNMLGNSDRQIKKKSLIHNRGVFPGA